VSESESEPDPGSQRARSQRARAQNQESQSPRPQSAEEALVQAGVHARAALAESVLAVRALLDAASLAASGVPSDEQDRLASISATLDALADRLGQDDRAGASLLSAVFEALDEEIHRWEERSREDATARPVVRAFIGLREILWELGVRPTESGEAAPSRPERVTRVPVES
jgi:hypothetical protein